jgi:hypothetical protein
LVNINFLIKIKKGENIMENEKIKIFEKKFNLIRRDLIKKELNETKLEKKIEEINEKIIKLNEEVQIKDNEIKNKSFVNNNNNILLTKDENLNKIIIDKEENKKIKEISNLNENKIKELNLKLLKYEEENKNLEEKLNFEIYNKVDKTIQLQYEISKLNEIIYKFKYNENIDLMEKKNFSKLINFIFFNQIGNLILF